MCTAEEKIQLVTPALNEFVSRVLAGRLLYCQHKSEYIVWDDQLKSNVRLKFTPPVNLFMRCGWYSCIDIEMAIVISTIDVSRPSQGWLTAILASCVEIAKAHGIRHIAMENVLNPDLEAHLVSKGWSKANEARNPLSYFMTV